MANKLDLSKELIGRRALVTGGTKGIGAAITQRLLDAGATVVVAARSRNDETPAGRRSFPAMSPRARAWTQSRSRRLRRLAVSTFS